MTDDIGDYSLVETTPPADRAQPPSPPDRIAELEHALAAMTAERDMYRALAGQSVERSNRERLDARRWRDFQALIAGAVQQ